MSKNRPIEAKEKEQWEQQLQIMVLEAMSEVVQFKSEDLVFHGGTNLKFSWGSPRYSEDLDFMISEEAEEKIEDLMSNILEYIQKKLKVIDPDFNLRLKHKSRREGQLHNFMLVIEKNNVLGTAKVKTEFWKVNRDFLNQYKSTLRRVNPEDNDYSMRMRSETYINAATLERAHCDKMVALATRPFLKWRDFFDIWWLTQQKDINPIDNDKNYINYFKKNLTAYSVPDSMTLIESLQRYLDIDEEELLKKSEKELQIWLPEFLWEKFYPETVKEMIITVKNQAQSLIELIEQDQSPLLEGFDKLNERMSNNTLNSKNQFKK